MSIYTFERWDSRGENSPDSSTGGMLERRATAPPAGRPPSVLRAALRSPPLGGTKPIGPSRWQMRLVSGAPQEYPLLTS